MWERQRGQTAVIGFVMVFGILMLLLVTLQTTAVPAWNQGEEFDHNQQVRDDLGDVRSNIFQTAATGRLTSKSVPLGTRYPRRPFLLNPADPNGRIETTEPGTVELTNLTADGEAGDYWSTIGNSTRQFQTRHLSYRPDYNEYGNAPTTIYENGVLYDRRGNRTRPLTDTPLVDGKRINLVTLTGNLSEIGTTAKEVTVEPVSAPQQVTSVTGDGPVRIRLPTRLDEETWNEILADEFVAEGGHVYDNVTVTPGDPGPYDTVAISLEGNQSYDMRLGRVRIGQGSGQPGPHYITLDSPRQTSVPVGETERVTVEVRDRYNNPVSGVTVDAAIGSGLGVLDSQTATTDEDGHATFQYTPSSPGTTVINASFGETRGELETATATVTSTAGGGGTDDTGPLITDIDTTATTASGQTITRGTRLDLTATATDFQRGGTDIYAVEWWSNRSTSGSNAGTRQSFVPTDGTFDTVDEAVEDTGIDTSTWETGVHEISVQAQDANGISGPPKTYRIEVRDSGQQSLITAVSPDPDRLTDTEGEFVRLRIPAGVDTTGWTLRDNAGSVSITQNLDGEVYFARNPTAFESQWPSVDSGQTLSMGSVQLNNAGETVELLDANNGVVDRFAYGGSGNTFDDGSSYTFGTIVGQVAVRQMTGTTFVDTDSNGDWTEQSECDFFGGGAGCSGGDTTPPTVSAFTLTNPTGQTLELSLDTDEPLGTAPTDLEVTLDGPETATFSRGDFTEQDNGDGTYTYTATYAAGSLGSYTASLTTARDTAGNDGASGETDSQSLQATTPQTAASQIQYVANSGGTFGNKSGGTTFQIENNGSSPVTITGVTIESTSKSQADRVAETKTGSFQQGQHEVYIDGTTDGVLDSDGQPYSSDSGTPLQFGIRTDMTENAMLDSGTTATIDIYQFQNNGGNPIGMSASTVTLTLHFADGTAATYSVTT